MDMRGCVWVRESFFKQWQVTDKITEWFLFTIHILHFPNDTNQLQGFENSNRYEGMCMSRGMFLNEWQVTDKIIESIFSHFAFNDLQMTQNQKITCKVSKIHKLIRGDVYEWEKVS